MSEESVLELFPEIGYIHSEALRDKSVACWKQVIELGGWEEKGIRNCSLGVGLVSEDCPEKSIDHCRRVVRMCQAAWDGLGEWANEIGALDHDVLICGAVLHDIGKFLEYDFHNGKSVYSPTGLMFRHVVSGAYIAKINGLPDSIVHIILAHSDAQSPEGGSAYATPELVVLKKIDHMCFTLAQMHYPWTHNKQEVIKNEKTS